ncbi:MAG: DUF7507 domain-containing protein [Christensenellales bacterium]
MHKHFRKKIALVMAFLMLFSIMPFNALAEKDLGQGLKVEDPTGDVSVKRLMIITPTDPPIYTHTYTFMNGVDQVDKQIIKNGESLVEPDAPEKADHEFVGWFVGDEQVQFGVPITVTSTEEFTANPKFDPIFYVDFVYNGVTLKTKAVAPNGTVDASDVPLNITTQGKVFSHWSETADGPAFDFSTLITANKTLYAVTKDAWTVTFESNGGSAVLPKYVVNNEEIGTLESPTRAGYTFKHWSLTDGGTAISANYPVTGNITLYAEWEAATNTSYKVVYWQENAENDDYTFEEVVYKTGKTGDPAAYDSKSYTGFHFDNAESKTISGNGDTVVNVYYKRNVYTFKIERKAQNSNTWYTYSTTQLKYGQSTKTPYNAAVAAYPYYSWYINWWDNTAYSEAPVMPNSNLTVYGRYSGSTYLYTIGYYEKGTNPLKQIKDPYSFYSGYSSLSFTDEDGIAIPGFTVTPRSQWDTLRPGQVSKIYYTRNNYTLTFNKNNGDGPLVVPNIPFESDISGKDTTGLNASSTYMQNGITHYFAGWYDNSACEGTPYTLAGKTMPAHNLALYAKWTPEKYTVTFYNSLNEGDGAFHKEENITPLDAISQPVGNPPGTDFKGWYWYLGGFFVKFNFGTPISGNFKLYPVFGSQTAQVTYNANGGTGNVPVDGNTYVIGAEATVKSAAGLTAPENKVFLGWNTAANGSGTTYMPNSVISVPNDGVTLYAKWGDINTGTFITYDANGGTGGPTTIDLANNETHTILANTFTRPGYDFTGWNSKADGSGNSFSPGQNVTVDRIDQETENILYAQWTPILTVTSGTKSWPYDGNSHTYQQYTLVYGDEAITGTEGQASFTLNDGKAVTITPTGKGASGVKTVSDTSANNNTFTVGVAASVVQGTHVFGTLEITPITDEYEITVTGNSASKVYNGSEQSVNGYTVSAYDSTITLTGPDQDAAVATAKGTNVGTYTMALAAGDFTATSDNYTNIKVTVVPGTLEITPITDEYEITVTGNSASKVYNGSEQSVNGYTVSAYDSTITLTGPDQDAAVATAKGTNVGTYTMALAAGDFTATSDNYTNIKVTVIPGTLEITPITDEYEITVTGNSASKVYNGSEQSVNGYTVSAYDSTITLTGPDQDAAVATAKGTNVGTYTMALAAGDFTATSDNYTNIKVTVVPGTLEITPITDEYEITVTGNSASKVYNGSEQSVNGYTVSAYDSTITLTGPDQDAAVATAKGTNVGTYTMALAAGDFTATSDNYTNIKVTVVPGTLEITPITDEYEITVTGNSASKVYNGSEQSVNGYTVSAYDSTITLTGPDQDAAVATAKGTNVGTYTMALAAGDFTATSDNYTNIKVTVVPGTLEITPITDEYEITVTGNSASKVYNGSEQSVNGYTVSAYDSTITLTGPDQDAAVATAKGTNVGTYTMALAAGDFTATSDNYTNIKVTVVPGTLEITPITDEYEITVTGNSASKVYNGSEQSVNGYTVSAYDSTITLTGPDQDAAVATAKGTNVGTYTMALAAGDFTATSDNYTNIKVTVVPGTLEITPITDEYEITVTGNSASKVYNGSEQSVNGYTVSAYDSTITLTGPDQDAAVATAKGTNVGTYTMALAAGDFTATSDNYTNIKVTVVPGTLEITPITDEYEITVTGNSASKVYNGSEQSVNGYTVSAYDSTITLTGPDQDAAVATAKGTNVGTYTMALAAGDFTATSDNYTNIKVTVVPGTLEITPITDEYEITVTGNSASKVYNGSEQSVNGYTVSAYDSTITLTGPDQDAAVATAKGTNVGTYTMALAAGDFTATSDNYTNIKVTVIPGTLEITPITDEYEITVTGNSASKVYNGSEQSVNGYTVSAYDSTITLTGPDQDAAVATAKGTNVGTYTMALAAGDFTATSDNYTNIKVTVVPGTLEITPITDEYEITVTGNSASKVYNGSEQSVNGYTVSAYDSTITLTGPDQDAAVATAKGTNVGTYTMALAAGDFTATSDNYTNIKVTVIPGTLEITPITDEYEITVTGNSASKVYNGSEQSVNGYTVSAYDSTITLTGPDQDAAVATAKGTNVGTYTMALAAGDFTATSDNYTNIKVTVVPGTLEITPITDEYEITVTGNSASKVYNGSEQSVNGYTVSAYDSTITLTGPDQDAAVATAKGTNVGTYTMALAAGDFTATSDNYTNIKVTVVPGTLEITPITDEYEITVTGNSASKVYNGSEQSVNGYTVSAYDSTITLTGPDQDAAVATAKGTNVGTYTMALAAGDFTATSDNYTNIKVTVVPGTLEITPITTPIVITANSDSKVYDGTPLTNAGYTYTENVLVDLDVLKAVVEGTITDVGTADNVVTSYKVMRGETDVTGNYTFGESVKGTLEITKRAVTLTSATDSKVYDGTALTNDTVEVTGDGWATDEGATYTVTGSQLDVGTSDNTFTYALKDGTLAGNYDIKTVYGKLTVTAVTDKVTVTITENSGTELYDGTEKKVTGYTVAISNPLYTEADFTFSGTASVSGTNAGTYNMELKPEDFTNNSTNFTNVEFVIVDGTLTINPKAVTITTGGGSKEYDGTPLTNATVGIEGLVDGESVTLTATGSQTEVGSSDNTYTIAWDKAKAGNYTVTDVLGTLTVTTSAAEVILTAPSASKTYDGTALTKTTGVTWDGLPTGFTVEATASGSQTDAGSSDNIVDDGYVIKDGEGNDKTSNFTNVTKVKGTLTVNPKAVTITTGSDSKPYDGTPLTKDEASIDGLVAGESVTLTATGSQTEVGSSTNTYTIDWGTTKATNYTVVTENLGTLTITQDPAIALEKTVDKTEVNAAGDVIYTYTIKNIGDVPLTNLSVTDDKISGAITPLLTELAPGASTTVTATYMITQAMMDAGDPIVNIATASGLAPDRETIVTSENTATVKISQEPQMTVKKSANKTSYDTVDEEIKYTVVVTNTGNITLNNLVLADELMSATPATRASLAVGDTWTVEYTHKVTQDDLDKGSIVNAVAVTSDETGEDDPTEDEHEIPADQNPAMTVEKSADKTSFTAVGEEIKYTVVVTNTGNITLNNLVLADELMSATPATRASLAVGDTWTVEYTHKVTQDDLDKGSIVNAVAVTSDETGEDDPTEDEHEIPADQNPAMTVEKSADKTSFTAVGEEIKYTVVVTNTGNITLNNLVLADELMSATPATRASLAVGDTWTVEYTYIVTQRDLAAGKVLNKVSVTKDNPDNPDEPELPPIEDEHVVPGPAFLDIETTINPTKSLTGRALRTGEFTFALRQGGEMLQSVTNDAEGNILFSPLVYTAEDIGQTYSYTIVEIPGTDANMTYSTTAINFTVSVKDAGDGVLSLTVNAPAAVIFFNIYTPPVPPAPEPIPEPIPEPAPGVPNFDLGVVPSNVADCLE